MTRTGKTEKKMLQKPLTEFFDSQSSLAGDPKMADEGLQSPMQSQTGPPDSPVSSHYSAASESSRISDASLLQKFKTLLHKELSDMSASITKQLTYEIRDLGHRTDEVENKLDEAVIRINEHDTVIQQFMTQQEDIMERLEDSENRSRRNNIRIRGLFETIKDLHGEIPNLLINLVPDIPADRMELDRVHRALGPRRENGPPLLHNQRSCYGSGTDLANITIQQRRALRPVTQLLRQHKIFYRWGFPFKLLFTFNNRQHMFKSLEEGMALLRTLRIVMDNSTASSPGSHITATANVSPRNLLPTMWERSPQ
uniref:Uncharacterized protein n=1 Tax=Xenopus tropicalis TaxID=8364 RepID=A0A803JCQ0_XENTR